MQRSTLRLLIDVHHLGNNVLRFGSSCGRRHDILIITPVDLTGSDSFGNTWKCLGYRLGRLRVPFAHIFCGSKLQPDGLAVWMAQPAFMDTQGQFQGGVDGSYGVEFDSRQYGAEFVTAGLLSAASLDYGVLDLGI